MVNAEVIRNGVGIVGEFSSFLRFRLGFLMERSIWKFLALFGEICLIWRLLVRNSVQIRLFLDYVFWSGRFLLLRMQGPFLKKISFKERDSHGLVSSFVWLMLEMALNFFVEVLRSEYFSLLLAPFSKIL